STWDIYLLDYVLQNLVKEDNDVKNGNRPDARAIALQNKLYLNLFLTANVRLQSQQLGLAQLLQKHLDLLKERRELLRDLSGRQEAVLKVNLRDSDPEV